MLCSVLITTRKRVPRLLALLKSLRDTASTDSFDVWLRVDDDDMETALALLAFHDIIPHLYVISGPRNNGWGSVHQFWDELYKASTGDWAWMMSDDMLIEGEGWDKLLAEVPKTGFIVHPQIHKLGFSTYFEDRGGPVPIVPRGALEKFGFDHIPNPPDTGINESLRIKSGWNIAFLKGIAVWHQRDDETSLVEERKH